MRACVRARVVAVAHWSTEERARQRRRRETLNPFVAKAPVQIDIWVLPWTTRADFMLQLQLAYMLSRDDFWTKHSYLRVCSAVGKFSELGSDAETDTVTVEARRQELYEEVWWKLRIPATIEVFDAAAVVGPAMWTQCKLAAAQRQQAGGMKSGLQSAQLLSVLNTVIRQQTFNTAISVLSMLDVPAQVVCYA